MSYVAINVLKIIEWIISLVHSFVHEKYSNSFNNKSQKNWVQRPLLSSKQLISATFLNFDHYNILIEPLEFK